MKRTRFSASINKEPCSSINLSTRTLAVINFVIVSGLRIVWYITPRTVPRDSSLAPKLRGTFDLAGILSAKKFETFGQSKDYRSRSWQQSVSGSDGILDATLSPESKQAFASSPIRNCCFWLGR